MTSGLNRDKLLIVLFSCYVLLYGCFILQNPKNPKIQFYPISDSNPEHSLLNGYLAIDSNNNTFIYSFVGGLIMSNSKMIYEDSILVARHGETYYQTNPLFYYDLNLNLLDNIDVAYDNFYIYYGKKNNGKIKHLLITINRDTSEFSYKQHKTLQFVYFDKSDIIQTVTSFSDSQDTIFRYNRKGHLTKTLIRKTKSKKFKKIEDNTIEESLKKYYRSDYWHGILDSLNTDYILPILESDINSVLSR